MALSRARLLPQAMAMQMSLKVGVGVLLQTRPLWVWPFWGLGWRQELGTGGPLYLWFLPSHCRSWHTQPCTLMAMNAGVHRPFSKCHFPCDIRDCVLGTQGTAVR